MNISICWLGIPSLVLESSDTLRATAFALTTWKNACRALDDLDKLLVVEYKPPYFMWSQLFVQSNINPSSLVFYAIQITMQV
ncbi:hypothetical protein RJT34_25647 [Clitoria ternatea]|uniref:Uncharacterized protein n=1 Tax=Clitoria ternatea TaxID=43366 RepID=A0AAN9IH16_CLITE